MFLSRYYPAYITKPSFTVSDQNFSFEIKTKEIDAYVQLLDNRLSGFSNSSITGKINLKANELNINADIHYSAIVAKYLMIHGLQVKVILIRC